MYAALTLTEPMFIYHPSWNICTNEEPISGEIEIIQ